MRLHTFWLRLISALENWFKYEFLKSMQNIFNKKSLVVKDPTIKIGIQVSFSVGISQTPRTLGSLREIGRLVLLSPWPWQTPCKANDTPVGQEMLATPNVCHLVFFFNGRFIWRKKTLGVWCHLSTEAVFSSRQESKGNMKKQWTSTFWFNNKKYPNKEGVQNTPTKKKAQCSFGFLLCLQRNLKPAF